MQPPEHHSPEGLASLLKGFRNELGLVIAVVAVVAVAVTLDRSYIDKPGENAKEILRQASLLGIFALGAAVVIISGGIDLSSGSVIAFSATICASFILMLAPVDESGNPVTENLNGWILAGAVAATIAVAFLIGTFHAWLITVIELPPFVATLGSLVGLRSLARLLVQDVTGAFSKSGSNTQIYVNDALFSRLGSDWRIPLGVFLVLSFLLWILMNHTVVGRHLYALGGNEQAARLSGIRTDRLKWLAYCIGTVTASIAGILYCSYVQMASPASQAIGYELNAIAAAVVGGCSLTGGIGTVAGTMLGALFLRVVIDAVNKVFDQKPDDFQGLLVGMLVVLAVAFNELRTSGGLRKRFFPGAFGGFSIVVLALLAGVIMSVMSRTGKLSSALVTAAVALVVLIAKKAFEEYAARKESSSEPPTQSAP